LTEESDRFDSLSGFPKPPQDRECPLGQIRAIVKNIKTDKTYGEILISHETTNVAGNEASTTGDQNARQ
jgi:hypothetical protein